MARIKSNSLNLVFVAMIYAFTLGGLLVVGEMQSAASGIATAAPAPVTQLRPIAPQRDISTQRMAPLPIDENLPPFWGR